MARPADLHAKLDLLRAAEEVFVEHGLDQSRVEEITARAGKSKGAFYLHFQSKEDAFRQIVEGMLTRLATCMGDQAPLGADWLQRWHEKDQEILEFMWQNRKLVRLVMAGGKSADFVFLIDDFANRACKQLEEFITHAVAAGVFRGDRDVRVLASAISGAYDRVIRDLVLTDEHPDFRYLSKQLQLFVLGGVAVPSVPSESHHMGSPSWPATTVPAVKK